MGISLSIPLWSFLAGFLTSAICRNWLFNSSIKTCSIFYFIFCLDTKRALRNQDTLCLIICQRSGPLNCVYVFIDRQMKLSSRLLIILKLLFETKNLVCVSLRLNFSSSIFATVWNQIKDTLLKRLEWWIAWLILKSFPHLFHISLSRYFTASYFSR
jgi:hypothetical protein